MPARSSFDPDLLRKLIKEGNTSKDIQDALGVTSITLKNHLLKLIQMDGKVYEIAGIGTRNVSPKVTKNGLKLSAAKMRQYGFEEGKKVAIEKHGEGKITITQKD